MFLYFFISISGLIDVLMFPNREPTPSFLIIWVCHYQCATISSYYFFRCRICTCVCTWYHMVLPRVSSRVTIHPCWNLNKYIQIKMHDLIWYIINVIEGIGIASERRLQIRGSLIRGKMVVGAWCCRQPNFWIQGPSKNIIVAGLPDRVTNAITGPWNWFCTL